MTQAQADDTRVDWEAALVQRACSGDSRAFERLYREHAGKVYVLCLRMTRDVQLAEDCTQETFINAWRALARFETRSSLSTWLHRIAVNVSLAKRRKASPVEPSLDDEEGTGGALEWTLETPVEVREIEAAIEALPDGARDALTRGRRAGARRAPAPGPVRASGRSRGLFGCLLRLVAQCDWASR